MIISRRLPGVIYVHRYIVYSTVILLLILVYLLFRWNLLCTNIQVWQQVNKMCAFYEVGLAVGSICYPLCVAKDINSLTCHPFKATEKGVFSAEWHQTKLVVKLVFTDVRALHWYDNGVLKYPTEKEFLSIVKSLTKIKLNTTLSEGVIKRLARLPFNTEETVLEKRHKEMNTLWVFLQDNEYLLTIAYKERDVFPQMVGTCGPYFAVEHMEPIPDTSSLLTLSDHREDWGRRLKTAVLMLELLEELETGFKEPFHMCDIKLEHFGFVKDGSRLKYLDLKHVYPKSIISSYLAQTKRCVRDEDCELYDCRTFCDIRKSKCAKMVSNNNLQVVCERIFLGWRMSNTVIVQGLLMSQHTPSELASILRQCANPYGHPGKPRIAPDEEIKRRLYNTLVEMEQIVNNNDDSL